MYAGGRLTILPRTRPDRRPPMSPSPLPAPTARPLFNWFLHRGPGPVSAVLRSAALPPVFRRRRLLDAALDYVKNLPESANVQFVAFTDHSNYFDTTGAANPEAPCTT